VIKPKIAIKPVEIPAATAIVAPAEEGGMEGDGRGAESEVKAADEGAEGDDIGTESEVEVTEEGAENNSCGTGSEVKATEEGTAADGSGAESEATATEGLIWLKTLGKLDALVSAKTERLGRAVGPLVTLDDGAFGVVDNPVAFGFFPPPLNATGLTSAEYKPQLGFEACGQPASTQIAWGCEFCAGTMAIAGAHRYPKYLLSKSSMAWTSFFATPNDAAAIPNCLIKYPI
jgi:hypothetical protein